MPARIAIAAIIHSRLSAGQQLLLLALGLIGLRAWLTQAAGLDLHFDEAQYWEWSQHLDLSYYSKGPLVAWLIAASTALFGHGEWQVRLPAWIAHGVFLALLFALVRDLWQDTRAAWWAVVLGIAMPLYFALGLVMTTDIFLMVFWTWGLWAIYRALAQDQPRAWYELGATIGLGVLAKLSILLLGVGAGLLVLLTPSLRHHLSKHSPWLGAAIALALASPVLIWNAQHDWVMFRHEMGHVTHDEWSWLRGAEFLTEQWLALSPLLASLAIAIVSRPPCVPGHRWLWLLSVGPLAFFLFKAFSAKVQLNWPAPVYIGLLALFAGHIPAFTERRRRLLYAGLGLSMVLIVVGSFPGLFGLNASLDPFRKLKLLQEPIEALAAQAPEADFLMTPGYPLAGELAFYWPRRVPVYIAGDLERRRLNQHDLWPSIDREVGRTGLFVSTTPKRPPELGPACESAVPLTPVPAIARDGTVLRTLYATLCRGYKPVAWPQPRGY
jgi:undecaprenyl-diphosphatase